ncbi:MAG TPA: methyltransferase domain-containing protein [Puia sp.]
MIPSIKSFLQKTNFFSSEKDATKAYDIWSDAYDLQPGNLMLDLDEMIFSSLIKNIDLKNKKVADIGCGTGRHWQKIYEKEPSLIMGFDISVGMLHQLMRKFPSAVTQLTTDNLLKTVTDSYVDCLITTLTIAHIKNIDEAIASWSRVLKNDGDLVITDFHPTTLANGGKRSFPHGRKSLSILNYIHPLEKVKNTFARNGLVVIQQEERKVNEEVRPYYDNQNALSIYNRFLGIPIIYGLHLKKQRATE